MKGQYGAKKVLSRKHRVEIKVPASLLAPAAWLVFCSPIGPASSPRANLAPTPCDPHGRRQLRLPSKSLDHLLIDGCGQGKQLERDRRALVPACVDGLPYLAHSALADQADQPIRSE